VQPSLKPRVNVTSRHSRGEFIREKEFCGADLSSISPRSTALVPSHILPASPHTYRWLPAVTQRLLKIPRRNNPKNSKSNVLQKEKKNLKQKEKKEKRLQAEKSNLEPSAPHSAPSTSQSSAAPEACVQPTSLQQQLPIKQNQGIIYHPEIQVEKEIPALMSLDLTRIPAKHRLGPAPSSISPAPSSISPAPSSISPESSSIETISTCCSSSSHAPGRSSRIVKEKPSVFNRLDIPHPSATTPEAVIVTKPSIFNRLGIHPSSSTDANVTQHPSLTSSLTSFTEESSVTQTATVTSLTSSPVTRPVLPTAPTTSVALSSQEEDPSPVPGVHAEEVLQLTPDTEDESILLPSTAVSSKVKSVVVVPASSGKDQSVTRKKRTQRSSDRVKTPGIKSVEKHRGKAASKNPSTNPFIL